MNPREIVALVQRHVTAIAIVLVLAAGLAYQIKHRDPGYADNATVAFVAPPNGVAYGQSLLVVDALLTDMVMGPQGQQQVRMAGGTNSYVVALVNLNNEEFPYYGVPYITVTTTSASAVTDGDTFTAVMNVLQADLAALQARQGAKPKSSIQLRAIAQQAGPLLQKGSRLRTFTGLAILTLIVSLTIATFLDKHPFKLGNLLRKLE